MNDLCIDIDYSQLFKHGQNIGGDVYYIDRNPNSNVMTVILSDGLGSGVRANVLASLTSHMASKLSLSTMDLEKSAEVIMDTLPIDSVKGISYSTFTIARIIFSDDKSFIRVELAEYDNPDSLRFVGNEPVEWDKTAIRLKRKAAIKEEIVYSSTFEMKEGDRLIFFSDGVAQSGIALGPSAKEREDDPAYAVFRSQRRPVQSLPSVVKMRGWGTDNVSDFIQKKLTNSPDISSRQLARAIVTEANKNDKYTPNDDITCCVIGVKKPRRTLIVTGAPRSRESDKKLGERIKNFDGLPPASKIDGIDLVTEGMLTLSEVAKRLTSGTLLKHMSEDAAKRMIAILRETDQVEIIVGTKINDEVDDPSMAAKIGLRFPTVDEIRRSLIKNYFKECEVQYI